jgi:uracil-DNA glycosylase
MTIAERNSPPRTLSQLNRAIVAAPPMVPGGTRAVLGEGPVRAAIAFVGEQPGDREDLEGRPFVGPAGQLLDRALSAAGVDRWWLQQELELVAPRIVVALGATAVLALAGKALPITRNRGATMFDGRAGYITVHPSYLLRLPDAESRRDANEAFVADIRTVRALAETAGTTV